MNRRRFFKNIGLGTAAVVIAPSLIVKQFHEGKILTEQEHATLRLHNIIEAYYNNGDFKCINDHELRISDTIIVSDENNEEPFIVTRIHNNKDFKALTFKQDAYIQNGRVMLIGVGRKFSEDE